MTNAAHPKDPAVFDAIVIGTGFGGAVTAARLVEAGQRICVLERGRRYRANDFPMYLGTEALLDIDVDNEPSGAAPDLSRWLWSVDQGIYDVRNLDDVVSVQAAGYGGGSLVYANVHLRAPEQVFEQGWPAVYRRATLDPYYDRVAYMLDVRPVPKNHKTRKASQLQRLAGEVGGPGRGHAFDPPLAVTFGTGDEAVDQEATERRAAERPWTNGAPRQKACDMRGFCCFGCRQGAKNSLDVNYLRLVEMAKDEHGRALAQIQTGAEVVEIRRLEVKGEGEDKEEADEKAPRYEVVYRDRLTGSKKAGPETSCKATYVFIAAGAVNTTELLLRSKKALWPAGDEVTTCRGLGTHYFPNADSLAAVFDCREPQQADYGPTITSALLYQSPRQVVDETVDDRAGHERFLWAIDFRPDPHVGEDAIAALIPDAPLQVGALPDGRTRSSETAIRLIEPPMFDVGGFAEGSGLAMMVVEAGAALDAEDGLALRVGVKSGAWRPFGRALGRARKLEDWFLVQDGGYPTDIEPLIGMMRSPLWLRRNRFLELLVDKGEHAAIEGRDLEDPGPVRFPLAMFTRLLVGVPRRTSRVSTHIADMSGSERDLLAASPFDLSLEKLLPDWFKEALAADRDELAMALAPLVGQMLEAALDDVAKQLVERVEVSGIASQFPESVQDSIRDVPPEGRVDLVRGLLRQTIQLLWGSEVAMAASVNRQLIDRIPTDAVSLANALSPFVGWLLNYREGNGHTGVLLTMGRDQFRGRLSIDRARDRLTARVPRPVTAGPRPAQEQVLRDIAQTWRGELRTNPLWTSMNRRITVHSQGGCPMCTCGAEDASGRSCGCLPVTRPDGEVIGADGLYVMDAAAFPTAVGVNPSATIAAVAEYKVERFIETRLGAQCHGRWKEASAPKAKHLRRWMDDLKAAYGTEHVLDPLAKIGTMTTEKPRSEPLGLGFKETMSGLFDDLDARKAGDPVDWEGLTSFGDGGTPGRQGDFERAERAGIDDEKLISLELVAAIDDVELFFRIQRSGEAMKMRLGGSIALAIDGGEPERFDVDSKTSYIQMFRRPDAAGDGARPPAEADGGVRRFFRYHIEPKDAGNRFWLEGVKVLYNDPRFDIWQDLATLYVEWFEGTCGEVERPVPSKRGILRLAPLDFFNKQLQTIDITPETADPARKNWAYAGFIHYFGEELANVYMAEQGMIRSMIGNLLNPSRGA